MDRKRTTFYSLLTFSFVMLFNPNITIVDLMPDFIAWFILAKLFEHAANSAVYFEEARVAFLRLGWLSLARIPAFFIVLFIRSHDVLDNNIYALASLTFGVAELILLMQATKNIFAGLFHVGERTEANALIAPLKISDRRYVPAESIKEFTYFFLICKTILYVLPDMFLLMRVSERGVVIPLSSYYPYVFLASQVLGYTLGTVWLIRIRKYARAVYDEGCFTIGLNTLAREDSYAQFDLKTKLRSVNRALLLISIASVCTIEITFNSFDGALANSLNGINLMPHFIYGLLMLFALFILKKHTPVGPLPFISGALYCISAFATYVSSVSFYSNYDLDNLFKADYFLKENAVTAYTMIEILSLIEFLTLSAFLVFFTLAMRNFVLDNTGLSRQSERYGRTDMKYHGALVKKLYIIMALGIVAGGMKCINVFVNSDVQKIFTTEGLVFTSTLPWFHTTVTIAAVIYLAFTIYNNSILKDEVKLKYTEQF